MNYSDGQQLKIGDIVELKNSRGVVVCSLDDELYSKDYSKIDWSYLNRGVLIEFEKYGLIHYENIEEDVVLIRRETT
ncbi:MAG: hypothetical protein Q7T48_15240 [Cellvibrio sp.]|uniref:hypothetical protein n=1 Tax=Cellvibrio sp. TaxID=1965322 RepID=UPI0027272C5A|nr:hypothetical protein [Cellvibrio sp.]